VALAAMPALGQWPKRLLMLTERAAEERRPLVGIRAEVGTATPKGQDTISDMLGGDLVVDVLLEGGTEEEPADLLAGAQGPCRGASGSPRATRTSRATTSSAAATAATLATTRTCTAAS
jgi:hypothetical protein